MAVSIKYTDKQFIDPFPKRITTIAGSFLFKINTTDELLTSTLTTNLIASIN